jgi:hypothetical protein
MKAIIPTNDQIAQARKAAEDIGLLKNSIRGGKGNEIGCLCEIVAADYFNNIDRCNSYDYDLICKQGDKIVTIDVKSKQRNVPPKDEYYASIAAYNIKQKCDYYMFASTIDVYKVYLIGTISKKRFFDSALFCKKGEIDPTSPPRQTFRFKADCYNLPYSQLKSIS